MRRHKDPETGTYDGLEIEGRVRCRVGGDCGIELGDVIKSVNGVSITSSQELLDVLFEDLEGWDEVEVCTVRGDEARRLTYFGPEQ